MKRLAAIILSALLLFTATSCDFSTTPHEESKSTVLTDSSESSEINFPDIPAEYNDIIDAYIKIADLTRYEGCIVRESINDEDYPNVSKTHIDYIFYSLMDSWNNGANGYFAGYAIKDVNGDGIEELFLTDIEYTIYAMFTLVNGEIVSHYFSFCHNYSAAKIDANGIFYTHGYGKGESIWYEILRLGPDGSLHGTTFGHYDMTDFGDPEVYNYYYTSDVDLSESLIKFPQVDGNRLTDDEYNDLVASYNEALKNLDPDGCGVTSTAGLKFYQVITEDLRK